MKKRLFAISGMALASGMMLTVRAGRDHRGKGKGERGRAYNVGTGNRL